MSERPDREPHSAAARSVLGEIDGISLRPFDPTRDWDEVVNLIGRANTADGIERIPLVAAVRTEWTLRPSFDLPRDVLVAELRGRLVAVVRVSEIPREDETAFWLRLVVDPPVRRRGLGSALLAWAERRSREMVAEGRGGPDHLPRVMETWASVDGRATHAFAERAGYATVHPRWIMIRDLRQRIEPAPLPAGIELRSVRREDHRRIWEAHVEAFRDHVGSSRPTDADAEAFFADPDFDFGLWRVAWAGNEVAGSVMVAIHEEANRRFRVRHGWLEHVSVRRGWRGRGLGTALVIASLVGLREAGLDAALLGVDVANPTGAIQVYKRTGFVVHQHAAILRKRLVGASLADSERADAGPFFHGTKADLRVGDLLTPGFRSNYRPDVVMNHIYFTASPDGAGLAAELAPGEAPPRVYAVEPTGPFEDDPNVTDKKFPGNPTRSYRSRAPLRILGELTDWKRLTPEALQAWRDRLSAIREDEHGEIIN